MTAATGNKEEDNWPLPTYRFKVNFGSEIEGVAFQEVSGLDTEIEVVDFRGNSNSQFSTEKKTDREKHRKVKMKRGSFPEGHAFWDWYNEISMNTIERRTVTIKLVDEKGISVMQWQLLNAWPKKITIDRQNSESNEVTIDVIEVAYEQLEINY